PLTSIVIPSGYQVTARKFGPSNVMTVGGVVYIQGAVGATSGGSLLYDSSSSQANITITLPESSFTGAAFTIDAGGLLSTASGSILLTVPSISNGGTISAT